MNVNRVALLLVLVLVPFACGGQSAEPVAQTDIAASADQDAAGVVDSAERPDSVDRLDVDRETDGVASAKDGTAALPDGRAAALETCRKTPGCACNGHPKLCDRRLEQVVFPATHNAMNNKAEGWLLPNQNFGLSRQLKDGVRGFLLDTYAWNNPDDKSTTSWLCHGPCALGSIRLHDALKKFAVFLAANPDEVLIFVIEDSLQTSAFAAAVASSGLLPYVITLSTDSPLPTLRTLIKTGRRLLVTTERKGGPPGWVSRFNDVGFDTPYSFKSMDELQKTGGPKDSCRKFRGTVGAPLFLINHWVAKVLPTVELSKKANTYEVLVGRAERCAKKHGRMPTLLAVDHYDVGQLFAAVRTLNGLD